MTPKICTLAIGATLLALCTGCSTGGANSTAIPDPLESGFTPLTRLGEINVSGDIFSDVDKSGKSKPRVLGEIQKGNHRIIAYVQEEACGLIAVPETNPQSSSVHLTVKWPERSSEGSSKYSGGPYSLASAAGSDDLGSWASLACSRNAMVIEYSSRAKAPSTRPSGNVSAQDKAGSPPTLTMVIGSPAARGELLKEVLASSEPFAKRTNEHGWR
ncbi:hypothetical protein [Streptomyces lavendofoliae]|uniref:hypothetical protein n=1 Tax=Streptomyces lavendofoliae TaxID=67314 RepID=UPI003D8D19C4